MCKHANYVMARIETDDTHKNQKANICLAMKNIQTTNTPVHANVTETTTDAQPQ
jgi:hypothetical protein